MLVRLAGLLIDLPVALLFLFLVCVCDLRWVAGWFSDCFGFALGCLYLL